MAWLLRRWARHASICFSSELTAGLSVRFWSIGSAPLEEGNETDRDTRAVGHGRPDLPERLVHGLPLAALVGQLPAPGVGYSVVLPPPPRLCPRPPGFDEAGALQSMEHRIEHAVSPLQSASGELTNPFQDGVAVAVPFGQDGEYQGRRRGCDEVFADAHRTGGLRPCPGSTPGWLGVCAVALAGRGCEYIEAVYIAHQCISSVTVLAQPAAGGPPTFRAVRNGTPTRSRRDVCLRRT